MKTCSIVLSLLIAYCGWAAAAEQSDGIGSKKLPHDAVLICKEHVNGGASGKSMHIVWQAFGLNEDIDKTAQFYQAQFGQPPVRDDIGRNVWRFKGEYSELIYSLQLSTSTGPWSGCSDKPINFKTILMISNGFWRKQS